MEGFTLELVGSSLGQVGGTVLAVVLLVVVLEGGFFVAARALKQRGVRLPNSLPYMLIAPAFIGLALLVFYPILYNLFLAFTDMGLRRFGFDRGMTWSLGNAWNNLVTLFTQPVLQRQTFFPVLLRTFLWTFIQVSFHVSFGLFLAILLNRPMKMRGIYRTLLLVPWAVPQVIAVLAWRGEFNFEFGFVNVLLQRLGFDAVQWFSQPVANFVAFNIVNIWLGIPFMAVVLLGGLQSIDGTYYEAAEIDGASKWMQFRNVTLPLIQPVMTPAVILGVIWTFNQFNVPFLLNPSRLETSDILVTALFRAAFEYNRYGFASMFAIAIFVILLFFTVSYMRITRFSPSRSIIGNVPKAVGE